MNLIGSAEWFISQLLHKYCEDFPDAIGINNKNISFDNLRSMGSVEEAKAYLIDSTIEETIRGGFDSWIEFLKKYPKLSMVYLDSYKTSIVEVFQRRNLLVHNGGIVNSLYFQKVPPNIRKNINIGSKIEVSRFYIDEAISKFEECFILIGAELWKKIEPENINRAKILNSIVYDHLSMERWNIAKALSYFVKNEGIRLTRDTLLPQVLAARA